MSKYKQDKIKNNPLGLLPKRLLVYRSCYPIRVNRANYNVGCAKNNIGVNIRVYQMTLGETFVGKYKDLPYTSFEVWRDISLYEEIRDSIVKIKWELEWFEEDLDENGMYMYINI